LPGMKELSASDLEGYGQRSLTRCLKTLIVFLALQLEPDPPDLYAEFKEFREPIVSVAEAV